MNFMGPASASTPETFNRSTPAGRLIAARVVVVTKHVVILGAGFAGLELATRLSEEHADEVRVTLIDQNDSFTFGFSKLDVMFGRSAVADVRMAYSDISKPGVEFRQERVTAIDPDRRRVETEAGAYEADILVIAMGAAYDVAATPGLADGGFEYYSVEGAARMRDVIRGFDSGRIVIAILGQPFKCPPAPFEAAMMLHHHFAGRGIRDDVEIHTLGPMAAPVPVTQEVSGQFLEALAERDIPYGAQQLVVEVDGERGLARTASGEEIPFDLFIGIPIHRVPEVVESSGLTENGWVPVDKGNLRTRFPDVYAVGDVAATPNPKAGVFAESAAGVVADDIAATLAGGELEHPNEGVGHCYLEFGDAGVAKVDVNFFGGPRPAAKIVGPSPELAAEKKEFAAVRRKRWFGG
jgi:sulfide:quinone oxidoreductase